MTTLSLELAHWSAGLVLNPAQVVPVVSVEHSLDLYDGRIVNLIIPH